MPKKDKKTLIIYQFLKLNNVTIKIKYLLPNINKF